MKLLISWVRDFVDITVPPRALADTMALRGFEVASVEPVGRATNSPSAACATEASERLESTTRIAVRRCIAIAG